MSNTEQHLCVRLHYRNELAAVRSCYVIIGFIGALAAWVAAFGYLLIVALLLIAFLEFYAGIRADSRLRAAGRPPTWDWILTSKIEEQEPRYRPLRDSRVTVERRRSYRRPTSAAGSIVFNSPSRLCCLVENICSSGAKLALTNNETLPSTFCLLMPESHIGYLADVIWRSDNKVGVRITQQVAVELSIKAIAQPFELIEQAA